MIRINRVGLVALTIATTAFTLSACSTPAESGSSGGLEIPESARTVDFDWGTFTLASSIVDRVGKGDPIRIISSYQGVGIPIAGAQNRSGLERGCEDANKVLPAECRLVGPASTDFPAQLQELETLLNSNQVDCLVLQSGEPNAFASVVDKYVDAGIPVFTQNGDVPDSKRFAYFALNEYDAAYANAQATIAVLEEAGIDVSQVAMGSGNPTAPWAQGRLEGFQAGISDALPDVSFFNTAGDALPTGENFTIDEVISSVTPFLSAHPDVNLFFHTDQGVEGVAQVIKSSNLSGEVFATGFNVSKAILEQMDSGDTLVTIDQGFDNQAAAATDACVAFLTQGELPDEELAYLDPIVVTKSGIDGSMTVEEARTRLEESE